MAIFIMLFGFLHGRACQPCFLLPFRQLKGLVCLAEIHPVALGGMDESEVMGKRRVGLIVEAAQRPLIYAF